MNTKLPAPRLQLRWVPHADNPHYNWACHYELVIALDKGDIRGEQEGPRGGRRPRLTEMVIPMKPPQLRGSSATPCTAYPSGERFYDAPYRDGAHAFWDSKQLGNLPVFVIAPDGEAFARPEEKATGASHVHDQ